MFSTIGRLCFESVACGLYLLATLDFRSLAFIILYTLPSITFMSSGNALVISHNHKSSFSLEKFLLFFQGALGFLSFSCFSTFSAYVKSAPFDFKHPTHGSYFELIKVFLHKLKFLYFRFLAKKAAAFFRISISSFKFSLFSLLISASSGFNFPLQGNA